MQNDPQNGYSITVTGPWGMVYPYTDSVKSYLMAEDPKVGAYCKAGDPQGGDSSIAPVTITWSDSGNGGVARYLVEYATKADYADKITLVKDSQLTDKKVEVYNLYKASTYYVRVSAFAGDTKLGQAEHTFQTSDLGPRIFSVDSLFNVRDLGGYVTADGKTTLQGMIYRGCEMDGGNGYALSTEGNAYMSSRLKIKVDLDLRGNQDPSPITSAAKKAVGIGGYMGAYEQPEQYRQIFSLLADENNYPVYIHCAGGADRTGTVCYLINALLGVPEQELIRDYEMTSWSVFGDRPRDAVVYDFAPFVEKLNSYEGNTLAEKTENYMLSIGVTEAEISGIRDILLASATASETETYTQDWTTGEIPLPQELAGEAPAHIFPSYNWENKDFAIGYLGQVQEDPDSAVGKAAVFDVSLWNTKDHNAFAVQVGQTLPVYLYKQSGVEKMIGQISYKELDDNANDGQYHLYKLEGITGLGGTTEQGVIYFFNWAFQCKGLARTALTQVGDAPVDLYLSMKVEGDITCINKKALPVYSIDRVILVTDCASYEFPEYVKNNDATCQDGTKSGYCPVCGKYATVTDEGSRKDHSFTNYVSNNNAAADAEGTKTAQCDYGCGALDTVYESGSKLPKELRKVDPSRVFEFTYQHFEGEAYNVEPDKDSVMGQTMVIDSAKFGGTTNNPYRVSVTNPLHIALWSSKETVLCDYYAGDLHQDGQYHWYKLEDLSILNEDRYNFLYLFTTWELRSYSLPKILLENGLRGETVDVYLSMKITGDVSCEDANNMAVYAIDRIIFVKAK